MIGGVALRAARRRSMACFDVMAGPRRHLPYCALSVSTVSLLWAPGPQVSTILLTDLKNSSINLFRHDKLILQIR